MKGRSGEATLVLEAVVTQDLYFWHVFFGVPGSCNNLNVLNRSPLHGSPAPSGRLKTERAWSIWHWYQDDMGRYASYLGRVGTGARTVWDMFRAGHCRCHITQIWWDPTLVKALWSARQDRRRQWMLGLLNGMNLSRRWSTDIWRLQDQGRRGQRSWSGKWLTLGYRIQERQMGSSVGNGKWDMTTDSINGWTIRKFSGASWLTITAPVVGWVEPECASQGWKSIY